MYENVSNLGKQEMRYLGHVISQKGVEMDSEKLAAIQ